MTTAASRLMNRKRLLDAARGLSKPSARNDESPTNNSLQPLRCFPLQSRHVQEAFVATTPEKFHSLLCHKIRNAKERVVLASLYVGPAASPKSAPKEQDLLDALKVAASKPNVQVNLLLDKNRALRPVPLSGDVGAETTSSAQAVFNALQNSSDSSQEDSSSLQYFLPNPINEVAGVFHMKVYIVDDSLILSGANLSEEYFVDRHDRYLHITEGGAGLVDFYGDLLQALIEHSEVYLSEKDKLSARKPNTRSELLETLNQILTTKNEDDEDFDDKTVAVVVPTFQAPESFFAESNVQRCFLKDTEVTKALLQTALKEDSSSVVRLSSAYLNPTNAFLRVLADFETIEFLTAGRISHGFAPKKKAGNKGKDWIPTVFETLSRDACQHLQAAKVLYYERPGWTFHAKGLWLESQTSLVAAICGSGNYGARSENLDMESNCVLILPPESPIEKPLASEWANLLEYTQPLEMVSKETAKTSTSNKPDSLSWPLQVCLPVLKKFF
jgi:CDP-diacylglycerol---glycerol-3-phosphate 3-phosphatidyltransferase